MTHRRIVAVLGAAGVFVHAPTSNATVSKIEQKCASKMATAARKLGDTYIKVTAKCRDSDLAGKTIGACPDAKGVQAIEKAAAKLDATIAKQCGSVCSTSSSVACIADSGCPTRIPFAETCGGFPVGKPFDIANLNFPGPLCEQVLGGTITAAGDIAACVEALVGDTAGDYIDAVYGSLVNGAGLSDAAAKCLKTIAGAGRKFVGTVYKSISKCHDAINSADEQTNLARLTNPLTCQRDDASARAKIEKSEAKLRAKIAASCDDAAIQELDLCGNGVGGTLGATEAIDCIVDLALETADTTELPVLRAFTDATFIEAVYPPPAVCGDGVVNQLRSSRMRRGEECDGADDAACPGQCLPAGDLFECTCGNIPRVRFLTDAFDAQTETDAGFKGVSHNQDVADLSGEMAELTNCDCDAFTGATCTGNSTDPVCDASGAERPRCSWDPDAPQRCDENANVFTCIDHDDPLRIGSPCVSAAECPCADFDCPADTCPPAACSLGANDGSGASLDCATDADCPNQPDQSCQDAPNPNPATCNLCEGNIHPAFDEVDADGDCARCDQFSINAGEFCARSADCEAQCYGADDTPTGPCKNQEDCPPAQVCRGRCDDSHQCLIIYEGGPQPVDTAGSFVCTLQQYISDFSGTRNIITGEHERFYFIRSTVHTGEQASRPCPVCGGFCVGGKQERDVCEGRCLAGGEPCRFDSDCATADDECGSASPDCPDGFCQLSLVCGSTTPDAASNTITGTPCNITYKHRAFGTLSNDCLPKAGQNISGKGLLVEFQPATSASTSLIAENGGPFACTAVGFELYDCHCPDLGAEPTQPNTCAPACDGGPNENFGCATGGGQPGAATTCDGGANGGRACDEDLDCPDATCTSNPTHCEGTGDANLERFPCTTNGDCGVGICVDACPGGRCVPLCIPDPGDAFSGICAAGPELFRCEGERFVLKQCPISTASATCDATCSLSGTPCASIDECPAGEQCEGPCAAREECEAGDDGFLGTKDDLVGAGACRATARDCFLPDVPIHGNPTDHTEFGSDAVWCQTPVSPFIDEGAGFTGPNRTRKRGVNVINVPSIP